MSERGRVGPVARALGFAGLLPQAAAVVWMIMGEPDAWLIVTVYALVILSFLGGMWWALAMRAGAAQPVLVGISVVPSLAAAGFAIAAAVTWDSGWVLVAIGVAILLTLLVDRWFARNGIAPEGWMALRVPLSIGLGGLTIVAGALAG